MAAASNKRRRGEEASLASRVSSGKSLRRRHGINKTARPLVNRAWHIMKAALRAGGSWRLREKSRIAAHHR